MCGTFLNRHAYLKQIIFSFMVLILLTDSYSSNEPDIKGEALIEVLKSLNDTNHCIRDWDNHPVSPCFSWSHVSCPYGHVNVLRLDSIGFSGTPSPAITKLKYLVNLALQNNNLSGVLPDFLGNLVSLQNLNLANNKFNGTIPASLGQLSNLKHLDLSSNNLTGRIPMQLFSVPTYNFTRTYLICGSSLGQPCVKSTLPVAKLGVAVAVAGSGAFALLCLGVIFAYLRHQMHNFKQDLFADVAGVVIREVSTVKAVDLGTFLVEPGGHNDGRTLPSWMSMMGPYHIESFHRELVRQVAELDQQVNLACEWK